MDKINRALYGVEDNAEAIRALRMSMQGVEARVQDVASELEQVKDGAQNKTEILCVNGKYKYVGNKTYSTFGKFRIDGRTILVLAPGDITGHIINFNGTEVFNGIGTLVYVLESGEGELFISPSATSPRVLLIGEATKIE